MKKTIICIVFMMVASLMYAATPVVTAKIQVKINSASSISGDNIMMAESLSWSKGKDTGDGEKKDISGNLQMWVPVSFDPYKLGTLATDSLENTPITVKTIGDTEYTFSFSGVDGRPFRFLDNVNDSVFDITNTAQYVVSLKKNTIIANRFFIVGPFTPDGGELEVCHFGDNLEIRNNPYTTNIVVKNEAGEVVLNKMPFATPQFISLESLPAGHYTVEFDNGDKKYVIAVKPEVTPTTPIVP